VTTEAAGLGRCGYNPKLAGTITSAKGTTRGASAYLYLSLLAVVVLFFHKPLFNAAYSFPWDFRTVQLPLITFLRDELRENRFALWNPYSYCGFPIYANIQACFFHPLVLAGAFISSRLSWGSLPVLLEWIVVLQVWIGGVAAYHLFHEFDLGAAPAWTGAVMFETGSYFASRAEHIDSMMAAAWMPLAWLAVWKLRDRLRLDWLAVLAAALGMSIWGGFPQATVAVFGSTVMFGLILAALRMARPSVIAWSCCACALGILLAAVPFIPTTQLTQYSVAQYRVDWLGTGGGLYWQSLVSLVAPNHYNIFDISRFKGPGDLTFLYLYSSIGGLLLAIFALLARRNRVTGLFALLLLFGMFWMLGDKTTVWRLLFPLLPEKVRIGIHPEYTYCIFSLALAGLAAIGLNVLPVRNLLRWAIGFVIAADLFLVGSGRPMNLASLKVEPGATPEAFDGSALLLREVRRYLNREAPPSRFDAVDASMEWTYAAPIFRIPCASGISPMALENDIQLRLFLHDGYRWGWYYPLEKLDSPVVDLMNTRYVVTRAEDLPRFAALPKFRHVASLPGNELLENTTALPRFFLVHQVRPVASLAEIRDLIQRHQIDLRHTAITNRPVELPPSGSAADSDQVIVAKYEPNEIELSTQASQTSFLVLSETDYPGWKAWIDDQPAQIYNTDIAFRGVVIPEGAHRLRMRFQPVILPISGAISLATAILLAISVFVYRGRASRIQSN
jgi:Bacterial membrane protein YfhO